MPAAVCGTNADCCNGACTCGGTPVGICDAGYFEGFDAGVGTWSGSITASGGVGVVAMNGDAYTTLGGYNSTFPSNGFATSIDMYLDTSLATGDNDVRVDYSVAINGPDCTHRRDFIFHIGTDPQTAGQFAISASNNAPGWPSNPARSPLFVTVADWYTFTHSFYDAGGGVLAVDLCVSGSGGSSCWTLSDPSDVIGQTVGGNRYGWFVTNQFDSWLIDNVSRT